MNNREIVRKVAQQSNASIWMSALFVYLVNLGGMAFLAAEGRGVSTLYGSQISLISMLFFFVPWMGRFLAKEIVRLEEKIEELERRIP